MLKIGLTGGIGSGKTWVADRLAEWGASVIDTDAIAHALTQPGGLAMPAIAEAFGAQALRADGAMDRDWMRAHVFLEPAARTRLEGILHPLIGEQTRLAVAGAQGCYLVFVVPLLVESGRWRKQVDRICVVDCDPETQVARVQQRSGLTEAVIRRIMAAQAARATRLAAADDVIVNDGNTTTDTLLARTRHLHTRYLSMASGQGRPQEPAAGHS
ncbi:dephospho-CoA kinase [Bordetella trematum]|uniref:Dephospho-CoA kinase n=1 Tax=Bordetella trematum TaxID=123899 RepID=A0A157SCB6_9BORD|nr:dephospho-CoA kinase [Bordetella trematum]AZR95510.1 dephospho-CoA kinase [Bordetella trematum]NNH17694.1 dephospho-CoA kinase [Bordetella trematum]SAI44291.1 dephospho-CoA kinase [Bordetella trematum]SAI67546.1 dephospho-CoA kinase [Bordetella trematum]SUV96093.1 dephospho-CoA kinase [Bordetella trematum]